jgi:glycosyltransferase 2 family protein
MIGEMSESPGVVPPAATRRWRRGCWTVVVAVVAGVVVAVMLARAPGGAVDALIAADTGWTLTAAALSLVPLVGMSGAVLAVAPVRLPLGRTAVVQVATTFANALTPAGAGGVALNARFLSQCGLPASEAVALMALVQVTSVGLTLAFLVLVLIGSGEVIERLSSLPFEAVVICVMVLLLLGLAASRWRLARLAVGRGAQRLRSVLPMLRSTVRNPGRLVALALSHVMVTAGLAATLYCCCRAFDVVLPFPAVLLAMLGGATVGAAAPVPGGAGTVEAATAAALLAAGSGAADAVAVALLFRVLTFWARLPLSWLALVGLRRSGAV